MPSPLFDPAAEHALLRALLAGDEAQLAEFTERLACVPRILGARNARLGRPLSRDELADVVQETFLTIVRRLPEFSPQAPLESWMFGICCLQLQNALRAKTRRGRQTQRLDGDFLVATQSSVDAVCNQSEVHALLRRLGGAEAEIIRMRHFDELTFAEAGAVLGLAENTVKARYYRGLYALRRMLGRSAEASLR